MARDEDVQLNDAMNDPRDAAVAAALGRLGAAHRAELTSQDLERLAARSWAQVASVPESLRVPGADVGEVIGVLGRAEQKPRGWLTPMKLAASVALAGGMALAIFASRRAPLVTGTELLAQREMQDQREALALADAVFANEATNYDDLWDDAVALESSVTSPWTWETLTEEEAM